LAVDKVIAAISRLTFSGPI